MQVLVVALCCFAAVSAKASPGKPEPPKIDLWNRTDLAPYQDAWKSINQSYDTKYYFLRSTYNNDSTWGHNFTCVNVKVMSKYENNFTVNYNTTFTNTSGTYSLNETVKAVQGEGYQTKNVIQWPSTEDLLNDTVVFTDGETCDVLYIPYKQGYELWVNQKNLTKPPSCCEFVFDLLTLGQTTYNISNASCI